MYLLYVTLVFSLALGPDVKLLKAQEATTEHMSMRNTRSTIGTQVTDSSPEENASTEPEGRTMRSKEPTKENLITEGESVAQSEENTMKTDLLTAPELLTTSELPNTAEPTVAPMSTNIMTFELSTSAAPPETTSQPKQETTMTNITTAEPPQTPSPSPTIPDPTTSSTEPPVSKSKPAPYETTNTLPTSTPTPTTTPMPITTPMPTTTPMPMTTPMPTTTTIITTTQGQTTTTPDTETSTLPEEMTSTKNNSTDVGVPESSADTVDSKKGANWLFIALIALVIFCILTTLCVITIIVKRRKRSGKQYFGHMNGQRSKKKKGTEDDVWAGPVKLGGGDGEGPEEGNAEGEEKKTDEADMKGLSTFVKVEENGGVGRPGSPEVEKWEEKEPLLFIDEGGKEKGKGKSEDADAKEGAGKSDAKEAEPNEGEAFCLTTAV